GRARRLRGIPIRLIARAVDRKLRSCQQPGTQRDFAADDVDVLAADAGKAIRQPPVMHRTNEVEIAVRDPLLPVLAKQPVDAAGCQSFAAKLIAVRRVVPDRCGQQRIGEGIAYGSPDRSDKPGDNARAESGPSVALLP